MGLFCISYYSNKNNINPRFSIMSYIKWYYKYYNKYFLFIPIEIKKVDNNLEYYIDKSKINLDKKVTIKKVKNVVLM